MKEAVMVIVIAVMMIMIGSASASVNHIVGGGNRGWSLNSDLLYWSSSTPFFVNDSLVFNYTPDHDVIEVNQSDFTICRINSPIATYGYDDQSGQTVISLTQPGWRYFICGRPNHCNMGLKVSVQVQDQQDPPSINQDPPNVNQNSSSINHDPSSVNQNQTSPHSSPHKSLGYSNHNAVTSARNLLQLCITVLGIMFIFAHPIGWHL